MTDDPLGPGDEPFWGRREWWRRAAQTAGGVWVGSLLAILGTIVAARALGASDYGAMFLSIAIVTSVATFLDITFEEATVFYGNRALAARDFAGLRSLVKLSLRVDIAIGTLVTAVLVLAAAPLADFASAGRLDPTLVQISAIGILLTTADSTAHAMLSLARRSDLRARGMAVQAAFRLVLALLAMQVGGPEAFAAAYALGGGVGSLVLGRMAWKVGWRTWDPSEGAGERRATTRELIRFAFHTSLATSVQSISGTIVPVLLGRAAGPTAVGIFRISMLPIIVVRTVGGPLRLAMFPEQAKLFADGRVDEIRRSTTGYTLIAFGVGIVGGAIAYVIMPWLIPLLYSSSFDAAVEPARILLIGALFNFALAWRKMLLAAIGRPEIRSRLGMIQLAVVATVLAFTADQGAVGAAIAVSAGSVASGVAWLIIARGLLSHEALRRSSQALSDETADALS